jgi:hypothetical protein
MFRYLDCLRNAKVAFPQEDITNMPLHVVESKLLEERIRVPTKIVEPHLTRERTLRKYLASARLDSDEGRYEGNKDYAFNLRFTSINELAASLFEQLKNSNKTLSWSKVREKYLKENGQHGGILVEINTLESERETHENQLKALPNKRLQIRYREAYQKSKANLDYPQMKYQRSKNGMTQFLKKMHEFELKTKLLHYIAETDPESQRKLQQVQEISKMFLRDVIKAEVEKLGIGFCARSLAQ